MNKAIFLPIEAIFQVRRKAQIDQVRMVKMIGTGSFKCRVKDLTILAHSALRNGDLRGAAQIFFRIGVIHDNMGRYKVRH